MPVAGVPAEVAGCRDKHGSADSASPQHGQITATGLQSRRSKILELFARWDALLWGCGLYVVGRGCSFAVVREKPLLLWVGCSSCSVSRERPMFLLSHVSSSIVLYGVIIVASSSLLLRRLDRNSSPDRSTPLLVVLPYTVQLFLVLLSSVFTSL